MYGLYTNKFVISMTNIVMYLFFVLSQWNQFQFIGIQKTNHQIKRDEKEKTNENQHPTKRKKNHIAVSVDVDASIKCISQDASKKKAKRKNIRTSIEQWRTAVNQRRLSKDKGLINKHTSKLLKYKITKLIFLYYI